MIPKVGTLAMTSMLLALTPAAPAPAFETKASGSWSGYLLAGTTFTAVSATWKQPAVTCPVPTGRVSFWVGIDGGVTPTIEQAGTIGSCNGAGKPVTYRAWWEMFAPTGSHGQQPFGVSPGDTIEASVVYTGGASSSFVLAVKDLTNGRHFSSTRDCGAPCKRGAIEWIVESPAGNKYSLADYKDTTFTAMQSTSAMPAAEGISVVRYNMVHANKPLSTCSLPASSSAMSPPVRIDCKWSDTQ